MVCVLLIWLLTRWLDDWQVLRTQVIVIVVMGWRWSLAVLWHYLPLPEGASRTVTIPSGRGGGHPGCWWRTGTLGRHPGRNRRLRKPWRDRWLGKPWRDWELGWPWQIRGLGRPRRAANSIAVEGKKQKTKRGRSCASFQSFFSLGPVFCHNESRKQRVSNTQGYLLKGMLDERRVTSWWVSWA